MTLVLWMRWVGQTYRVKLWWLDHCQHCKECISQRCHFVRRDICSRFAWKPKAERWFHLRLRSKRQANRPEKRVYSSEMGELWFEFLVFFFLVIWCMMLINGYNIYLLFELSDLHTIELGARALISTQRYQIQSIFSEFNASKSQYSRLFCFKSIIVRYLFELFFYSPCR